MIIVEGLDATGKSTLVDRLAKITCWATQKSEGPEKYPGEILDRCDRYRAKSDEIIFDRHPVISQQVYGKFTGKTPIPPHYIELLKVRNPLVIYASAENKGEHIIKEHDNPEHLEAIHKFRDEMEKEYLRVLKEYFPGFMVYKWQFLEAIVNGAANYANKRRMK